MPVAKQVCRVKGTNVVCAGTRLLLLWFLRDNQPLVNHVHEQPQEILAHIVKRDNGTRRGLWISSGKGLVHERVVRVFHPGRDAVKTL